MNLATSKVPSTPAQILAARKRLGLSQRGMARSLGMSKCSIENMERGRQDILIRTGLAVLCLELLPSGDRLELLSKRIH